MDSKRQAELFRVFVKDVLRKKGLRFDNNLTRRDMGREVKELNDRCKLEVPITVAEFCELYRDIMMELVAEHFETIEYLVKASKNEAVSAPTPGTSDHEE